MMKSFKDNLLFVKRGKRCGLITFLSFLLVTIILIGLFLAKQDTYRAANKDVILIPILIISFILSIVGLIILSAYSSLSIREYNHDGTKINTYAGFTNYYLYVNDELVNKNRSLLNINDFKLKGNIDGKEIIMTVTPTNGVNVTIDGKTIIPAKITF